MSEPNSRRNLPDEIMRQLQGRIFRGEVKPGERLPPERELALTLGTNRNTLREALRALEAQGLVRARQGDGVRVRDYRQNGELGLLPAFLKAAEGEERDRTLADLLRVRMLAALEAASLAAQRATADEVEAIRGTFERLIEVHGRAELPLLAETELALYRSLAEAANSLAALWLFNSVEKVIRGLVDLAPDMWVTPECYVECWTQVVEAVSRRDAPGARDALRRLLRETDRILLALLGREPEEE